jgi:maltose-binding protein MalE
MYQKTTTRRRKDMKKLMVIAAMLAMALIVAAPATAEIIDQENEQESESGDVDQSFEVSSSGDNSNQCAGIQGVANTGNAQNQIDLIQFFSDADDFEFDEVGSDVDVSPENSTSCDQQVNQAASASG